MSRRAIMRRGERLAYAAMVLVMAWRVAAAQNADPSELYREAYRPQFHFTSARDWINDPNGLVAYEGEYHLFFQRDPTNINGSGYKTWGHAIGTDLVHWRQRKDALTPDELGSIWSGSAVVDWMNTSGLGDGDKPPLVLIYTAAGGMTPESQGRVFTQCIAYSNDRGQTWTKYEDNPVLDNVANGNRDPKVTWHEPSRQWVMALYLDGDRFGLFGSADLKTWRPLDEVRVPGSSECPDFFEMPIEGEPSATRWILWTANNAYLVGRFDGKSFTSAGEAKRGEYSPDCYAAQTFSDIPPNDGRRILLAWMRNGRYPGMPFNQQLSVPTVLTLRRFPEGLRLCKLPIAELRALRGAERSWSGVLRDGDNPLADLATDCFEIEASIEPGAANRIEFNIRGTELVYDVDAGELTLGGTHAPTPLVDGVLKLHLLVDRTSIEAFAADGRSTITQCFLPAAEDLGTSLAGAGATVKSLRWHTLGSIWPPPAERDAR